MLIAGRISSCSYSFRKHYHILPLANTKTLQYLEIYYGRLEGFTKCKLIFFDENFHTQHLCKSYVTIFFLDFSDLDSNIFLGPFLEVIRSEDTTGPITGVALSSINKFLSYGLIGKSF